ncbi:MAG: ATP-binding protein [Prevotella sp.]|nr:ATP-binding protein [Prevotella sp.]
MFERFKKLDAFKQGSGLGLYISRTIAEKMGGSVDIDRQYTPDARFVFTIPDRQA